MICSPAAEVGAAEDGPGAAEDGPGAAEDDGWLLSLVHDHDEGRSELVVIDPRNLRQPQRASSCLALCPGVFTPAGSTRAASAETAGIGPGRLVRLT